jgi:hypothetical protein
LRTSLYAKANDVFSSTKEHGYVPLVVNTFGSFPPSWLITGVVTRLIRRVPLVERALLTLQEHPNSPLVFIAVRVTQSLIVVCVCFVDRSLCFCTFSFGHCVVCSSSIYGVWLPLWYIQTLHWKTDISNLDSGIQPHRRFIHQILLCM